MEKIGIFGGTFDPVHIEHINSADAFIKELGLDRLIIMPAYIAPHKKLKQSSDAECRLEMCRLAFKNDLRIQVSDYEINNKGKSYTYSTLKHFSEIYQNAKLYFLIGSDMLFEFESWKNPEKILSLCTLTVIRREKYIKNLKKEKKLFYKRFNTHIKLLKYKGRDISSTDIRMLLSLDTELNLLIKKDVYNYINKNNLYYDPICDYVKKNLSEKRFSHTQRVAKLALELCYYYNVDKEKAFYAAVLHDVAKGNENKYDFETEKNVPEPVKHQYIGAEVAKNILNIKDNEILDAIKYHTSGKEDMKPLSKLIFVCDMLEENRDFEGVNKLRRYLKTPNKCFKQCLKRQYFYLKTKNKPIYELTTKAYKYYFDKKGEKN